MSCGKTPADGAEFSLKQKVGDKAYRHSRCKDCTNRTNKRTRYRISEEEHELLMAATHCPICNTQLEPGQKTSSGAVIDHCHMTGEIREVICQACNKGLGLFYDQPEVLRAAAEYIEKHDDLNG